MASNHNVQIRITAQNAADPAFKSLISDLNEVGSASQKAGQQAGAAGTMFGGFGRTVAGVAGGIGAASLAMGALSKGFGFVTDSVFGVNNSLEQTKARLVAFTKDGAEAERILRDIREEASRTPFAFEEMASATASLLPLAQQSNIALMDLVETAEILAASNPMEGLAGAAFALREALSGDFTSIIERFNLPRVYINQLKEEGVPNIEIVRQSMQALGYDASLVGNLAETTAGQWSTLRDELSMLIADLGKPIFSGLGAGIKAINDSKDELGAVKDDLGEIAQALGTMVELSPVGVLIELTMGGDSEAWDWVKRTAATAAAPTIVAYRIAVNGAEEFNDLFEPDPREVRVEVIPILGPVAEEVERQEDIAEDRARLFTERANDIFLQGGYDAARNFRVGVEESFASNQDYLDSYFTGFSEGAAAILLASDATYKLISAQQELAGVQGDLNGAMQVFSRQGSEYASTQKALEEGYEIIQDKQARGIELTEAEQQYLDRYPELYGRLAGAQEDAALQEGLVAAAKTEVMLAQDELNAAIARGEKDLGPYNERLRDANNLLSEVDPQSGAQLAIENLTNAINTNLVTAINDLITKMNELDGMTAEPDVKLNHDEFIQKKEDVLADLGTVDESSSEPDVYLNTGGFDDGAGHVYQTMEDLDGLSGSATFTMEARFISTGDPLAMQVYGTQTASGYVGIVEGRAQGGFIDGPELALIGEDGPELVLPLSKPARMRQLLSQAGIVPMAEGGIVGGSTSGGMTFSAFGSPDWGFLFEGLDVEAEDYTDRAADAFRRFFDDVEDLATGDAIKRAKLELRELLTIREIAVATGAGESVIAGLDAEIATKKQEVAAIGVAMGSDVVRGLTESLRQLDLAAELAELMERQKRETREMWLDTLGDLDSIVSGDRQAELEATLADLRMQLKLALVGGLPEDVAIALRRNIAEVQRELNAARDIYEQAANLGLVADPFQMPLETIAALLPEMRDGGASMIDELVAGIADGATDLSGVMGVLDGIILAGTDKFEETIGLTGAEMMDTLEALEEQLTVNLAQALITGAEDTAEAIQTQIDAVVALMEHVEATADTTVESLLKINAVSGQIIKPPSGAGFVPRSGGGGGSMSPAPSLTGGGAGSVFAALGPAYYGTTFNLVMPNANLVASWYSGALASDVALEPVTIG